MSRRTFSVGSSLGGGLWTNLRLDWEPAASFYRSYPEGPGTMELLIDPATDATGAYLPGTSAQKLVFGDTAGNRTTETIVFTVAPGIHRSERVTSQTPWPR